FPVLMALALGIAFRSQGPPRSRIGVEAGPRAGALASVLAADRDLEVLTISDAEAETALRRGRIAVFVQVPAVGDPVLSYDPTRPETRFAYLAVTDAIERAAGRSDPVRIATDTHMRFG